MKIKRYATYLAIAALSVAPSVGQQSDKSLGDKTAETLDKIGDKAKDAGRTVGDATKRTVESVKDAVTPDADARKVNVRLVEHKLDMPKQVAPGKTAFVVTNAGTKKHNFEIEGQGLEKKFLTSVDPSETKTLQVDLKPGSYKVYCPVGDHEEHGMKLDLTVK